MSIFTATRDKQAEGDKETMVLGQSLFLNETYKGCVLETGEFNGRDDSDFYALVWDETESKIKRIEYATTRFWTYGNSAQIDATPEVKAKALAYWLDNYAKYYIDEYKVNTLEPQIVDKGDKVIFSRKVNSRKYGQIKEGTKGKAFWCGAYGTFYKNGYNKPCRANRRAGVELENGQKVFVALSALSLDRPLLTYEEGLERAKAATPYYLR